MSGHETNPFADPNEDPFSVSHAEFYRELIYLYRSYVSYARVYHKSYFLRKFTHTRSKIRYFQ